MKEYRYPLYNSTLITKTFFIKELRKYRKINVYLPSTYDGVKRFPVIYMFDSQNLFLHDLSYIKHAWNVENAIENSIKAKESEGYIVVGVYTSKDRLNEYAPCSYLPDLKIKGKIKGEKMMYFYTHELKDYIDKNYLTLSDTKNTFLAGSSCGGNMSLFGILEYPNIYGGAGVFSIASSILSNDFKDYIRDMSLSKVHKIYYYIGGEEGYTEDNSESEEILKEAIYVKELLETKGVEIKYTYDESKKHNEYTWEEYFPEFITFISEDRNV